MSKEQFLMVPYAILNNKQLSDADKFTLSLIYSFYNNDKKIFISNNKLGERLGISRTAASERITKLEKMGYIKCDRKKVNGIERRTIIPLRMVALPNELVGEPNTLVGKPNSTSRQTEQEVVGEPGSIIYPSLLDNSLDKLLNTHITLEQLEHIDEKELTPEQRGNYFMLKNYITKQLKENEQTK